MAGAGVFVISTRGGRDNRLVKLLYCGTNPERVSDAWVFRGTRVPVAALFENLEDKASVHEFVEWFPGVTLLQAREVLGHAAQPT